VCSGYQKLEGCNSIRNEDGERRLPKKEGKYSGKKKKKKKKNAGFEDEEKLRTCSKVRDGGGSCANQGPQQYVHFMEIEIKDRKITTEYRIKGVLLDPHIVMRTGPKALSNSLTQKYRGPERRRGPTVTNPGGKEKGAAYAGDSELMRGGEKGGQRRFKEEV